MHCSLKNRALSPFVATDAPDLNRMAFAADDQIVIRPAGFAQTLRDSLRGLVVGVDERNQFLHWLRDEAIRHCRARGFRCIALTPILFAQGPPDFEARPSFRIDESNATDHGAIGLPLNHP